MEKTAGKPLKIDFRLFALCNILSAASQSTDIPLGVADRVTAGNDPTNRPVGSNDSQFDAIERLPLEESLYSIFELGAIFGMSGFDPRGRSRVQAFGSAAPNLLICAIDVKNLAAIGVSQCQNFIPCVCYLVEAISLLCLYCLNSTSLIDIRNQCPEGLCEHCDDGYSHGPEGGDTHRVKRVRRRLRGVSKKGRRSHAGIVHHTNRSAHYQCTGHFCP